MITRRRTLSPWPCILGQPDMTVSSILGRDMCNVAMLAIDDLAHLPGLLSHVASPNAVTHFATVLMGTIAIAALLTKTRMRVLCMVIWHSIVIVTVIVFALSSGAKFRFGLA